MLAPEIHILRFIGATSFVIGLLYCTFLFLRNNPRFLQTLQCGSLSKGFLPDSGLVIESRLPLEARKTLYVVRHDQQRFLIATSGDQTELLQVLPVKSDQQIAISAPQNGSVENMEDAFSTVRPLPDNLPLSKKLLRVIHANFGGR